MTEQPYDYCGFRIEHAFDYRLNVGRVQISKPVGGEKFATYLTSGEYYGLRHLGDAEFTAQINLQLGQRARVELDAFEAVGPDAARRRLEAFHVAGIVPTDAAKEANR